MPDDICEFTDISKAYCSHCKQPDPPKPSAPTQGTGGRPAFRTGGAQTVLAQFESECPVCDKTIYEGDPIMPLEEVRILQGKEVRVKAENWRHRVCP